MGVVRLQCIVQKAMVEARHRVTIAGQAGTAMYVIVSGTARMEVDLPEKKTSRLLGGGDSFGEEILLRFEEQYGYTTTATERMQLQMILVEEFMQLFSNMPNIVDRMRRNFCDMNPKWKSRLDQLPKDGS